MQAARASPYMLPRARRARDNDYIYTAKVKLCLSAPRVPRSDRTA